MARWIHEFRSTGERALTEGERLALGRRACRLSLVRFVYGLLTVVAFIGALACLMAATTGPIWVWPALIPFLVFAGYALSWAKGAEKLTLLHRRALRLGTVEGFRRVPGDDTARRLWTQIGVEREEEDGEKVHVPTSTYWSVDERFEESLAHSARGRVGSFEAVGRDGAVLWVEGRPVRRIIEPPVWEVVG